MLLDFLYKAHVLFLGAVFCTECPKIYRKYVLYLIKYTTNLYLQMQYRFAVNFETLSISSHVHGNK